MTSLPKTMGKFVHWRNQSNYYQPVKKLSKNVIFIKFEQLANFTMTTDQISLSHMIPILEICNFHVIKH